MQSTVVSKPTIVDWHNHLREVCLFIFQRTVQMGGPGKIVQIDESYFNGKRKNNKGRKLLYDKLKCAMDADQTGSSNFNVTTEIISRQQSSQLLMIQMITILMMMMMMMLIQEMRKVMMLQKSNHGCLVYV